MAIFVVAPLILVVVYAVTTRDGSFTLENFSSMLQYAPVFGRSFLLAFIATVVCILLGYPMAYILAHEAGKASIIVVNKWDLIEKDGKTMDRMREEVRQGLAFMSYAPILFISAKTGQRVDRLFELITYVSNQASTRITTGMLNNVLADAQTRVQPPTDKGRRLKIYYMTQVGIRPPHFVVFCNDARLFHFSYQRYLENCIRNTFGLEGTPVILSIRQKGDKEE